MIEQLLNNYKTLINQKIDELLPKTEEKYQAVVDAARYSLLLGGKRIRPILLLEFYKLCGGRDENALNFAVALEMIHTYSLIHDDLPCMDNDDMRRGHPSCHKAYGEDIALLAGDALLTTAFSVATKTKGISADKIVKSIGVLSEKSGISGMIGGQVIDLSLEGTEADIETIKSMYLKKTGCLLEAAAEIGCILAGADENELKCANIYAQNTGLAFQVIDDILDCTGNQSLLGKPTGSDLKNEKTTYTTVFGVEKSHEIAAKLTETALSALSGFKGDTSTLKELTLFLLNRNY